MARVVLFFYTLGIASCILLQCEEEYLLESFVSSCCRLNNNFVYSRQLSKYLNYKIEIVGSFQNDELNNVNQYCV